MSNEEPSTASSIDGENVPKKEKQPPYTEQMTIEGVIIHVRALVEQGRVKEFLDACRSEGYASVTGPEGLIEFAKKFIDAYPVTVYPSGTSGSSTLKYTTIVRESLQSYVPPINHGCRR